MEPVRDLERLLTCLEPSLGDEEYVFCFLADGETLPLGLEPVGTFREENGLSLIVARSAADRAGLRYDSIFRRITLRVHSSLEAVGLTASVAGALAHEGIAANVVAAFHHDHVFVPAGSARAALEALKRLQRPPSAG